MTTFAPKGQFSGLIMPKWLLTKKDAGSGAKLLYMVLVSCAKEGCDHCWPSQAYLADALGASVRSVGNWLRELECLGLIAVRPGRPGSVSRYYFLLHESVEFRKTAGTASPPRPHAAPSPSPAKPAQGYANIAEGYAKFADVYTLKRSQDLNSPLPSIPGASPSHAEIGHPPPLSDRGEGEGETYSHAVKSADQGFARVWKLWPVKQAQKPALELWRRLWFSGRLPQLEILLNKIAELQEKDRWWRNGKVPLLVNWLRDARWQDAPVSPAPEAGPGSGFARNRLQDGRSLMERNLATVARVIEQRSRENGRPAF